jgi:DNA-directed RNA polymerase specialized sigma24 family protein
MWLFMNERISRGPQQAVRDDGLQEFETIEVATREVPIDDLSGNKETALLLKMPDSRVGPETAFFQGERRRILSAAMADLTPRIRRAIELLGELSTKETARMMRVSVGAVKA